MADEYNPDLLFISDANLFNYVPEHQMFIEGYNLIKAKTVTRLGYSRIVLLCKVGIKYRLESERMEDNVSSIWVKVGVEVISHY